VAEATQLATDTVRQCVDLIKTGKLMSQELVQHHLSIIEDNDKSIKAWAVIDKEIALKQANKLDDIRRGGKPVGALHGIPVGLKDIYDTVDYTTSYGSPIHAGHQPEQDCRAVELLKEAGAVIMGKTVTTEFAFMHPSETCNPHNTDYSPGGSSSGSAASVAAGHVPLALGSQTNGSVIRPASFCGVYGYKPSRGIMSRRGVLETASTLDNLGLFGRDLGDLALLADALSGYDSSDSASYIEPKPALLAAYESEAPVTPALAWIDMPYADKYTSDVAEGFNELMAELDGMVERIPAPQSFSALVKCHKIIHEYELIRCLDTQISSNWDQISDTIKPTLTEAKNHTDESYQEALEIRSAAIDWFTPFFHDYDAILTPAALSEAPLMGSTGDPICCTIWTLCGLPCLTMPLLNGGNNLPVGVQLVGALKEDDRLFRTASYVLKHLLDDQEEQST